MLRLPSAGALVLQNLRVGGVGGVGGFEVLRV